MSKLISHSWHHFLVTNFEICKKKRDIFLKVPWAQIGRTTHLMDSHGKACLQHAVGHLYKQPASCQPAGLVPRSQLTLLPCPMAHPPLLCRSTLRHPIWPTLANCKIWDFYPTVIVSIRLWFRLSCMFYLFYCILIYGMYARAMTLVYLYAWRRSVGHYTSWLLFFRVYFSFELSLVRCKAMFFMSLGFLRHVWTPFRWS